jgi:hypothetical protein
MAQTLRSWEKLSNSAVLQHNLVLAGLYLVAYELLRGSIVGRLRLFFAPGGVDADPGSEYGAKVLALYPKDVFHASCLWLRENQAISEADVVDLQGIRDHRNELAHELPSFLVEVERVVDVRRLERIRSLVTKVEHWWIREVEIPTHPDFDGQQIADNDIRSGVAMFLDMVVATALQTGEKRPH